MFNIYLCSEQEYGVGEFSRSHASDRNPFSKDYMIMSGTYRRVAA